MINTSYHNHTKWSDGSATVPEMIDSARKAGLQEVGFSDHFVLAPGGARISWALQPDALVDYVAQIEQQMERAQDITIRLGLEVDYFPDTIQLTQQRLDTHQFDYLIASVHFVDEFSIDLDAQTWEGISQDSRDAVWRGYWERLHAVVETGFFDIVGHFDLPKKFGFYPSTDLSEQALSVLDAIAAADMAIEINTSGWDRPVGEAYPSLFYLQEANRRGIPLVINSDAHAAGEVVRHFDRARQLALAAGYGEVVRFDRRRRIPYGV